MSRVRLTSQLLFFMVIELVGFPFGAGIGLQICLLPLFPNATLASRFQDFIASPFLSVFVAWLFGTLYVALRPLSLC